MGEIALVPIFTGFTAHVVFAQLRLDLGTSELIAAKILRVSGIRSTGITIPAIGLFCVERNSRENDEKE